MENDDEPQNDTPGRSNTPAQTRDDHPGDENILAGFDFEATPPPHAPSPELDPLQVALDKGKKVYDEYLKDSFVHDNMSAKSWCSEIAY